MSENDIVDFDFEEFITPEIERLLLQAAEHESFEVAEFVKKTCPYQIALTVWWSLVENAASNLVIDGKISQLPYQDEDVYCLPENYEAEVETMKNEERIS